LKTQEILCKLKGVRQTGHNQWKALCPVHDDKNQSLSIRHKDDKTLIYCFAGCGIQDILQSLTIEPKDLFDTNGSGGGVYLTVNPVILL